MLRELGVTITIPVKRERDSTSKSQQIKKKQILENSLLMSRAKEVNQYDLRLYQLGLSFFVVFVVINILGKERFCQAIRKYDDLKTKLLETRVTCP